MKSGSGGWPNNSAAKTNVEYIYSHRHQNILEAANSRHVGATVHIGEKEASRQMYTCLTRSTSKDNLPTGKFGLRYELLVRV